MAEIVVIAPSTRGSAIGHRPSGHPPAMSPTLSYSKIRLGGDVSLMSADAGFVRGARKGFGGGAVHVGKVFFWGLGLNVAGGLVQMMRDRVWILYGQAARSPLPYWPAGRGVGQVIAWFGGSMMALAGVVVVARFIKRKMPPGTSTAAAVIVELTAFAFWVLLPMLLVTLVTQGDNLSAIDAVAANTGGHGFVAHLLGAIRYNFSLVPLFILGVIPALLRRWLPWTSASPRFRSLVPSWLAGAAALPNVGVYRLSAFRWGRTGRYSSGRGDSWGLARRAAAGAVVPVRGQDGLGIRACEDARAAALGQRVSRLP